MTSPTSKASSSMSSAWYLYVAFTLYSTPGGRLSVEAPLGGFSVELAELWLMTEFVMGAGLGKVFLGNVPF